MASQGKQTFTSIWDALAESPAEAANMRLRSELMDSIAAVIESRSLTQAEAASQCGISQPRINDLLRGRISRFSLDALVNIAASLRCHIHIELAEA